MDFSRAAKKRNKIKVADDSPPVLTHQPINQLNSLHSVPALLNSF
jgi:hypothetical protein